MLEELLTELNNWFVAPDGIHTGTFTVSEDGSIALPFLRDGQYFRIVGSESNDGLYQYPATGLVPESFTGLVWVLAIPKAVITLSEEISAYRAKNKDASPFTSESFGGYSYTKATNSSGLAVGWRDVFASRMSPYRKMGGNYGFAKPNPRTAPPVPPPSRVWR